MDTTHAGETGIVRTRTASIGTVTGTVGAVLFVIGTALHPARHGHGVAAVGELYGVTHAVQAGGLALLALLLASGLALAVGREPAPRLGAWYVALAGTVAWFGLIVYDGALNPAVARSEPDLVHAGGALDPMGMAIVLPALLLFPAGYLLLARALPGQRVAGRLLGVGATVYTIGGLLIFAVGPESALIQPLEVVGATGFGLGAVLLGRALRAGNAVSPEPT